MLNPAIQSVVSRGRGHTERKKWLYVDFYGEQELNWRILDRIYRMNRIGILLIA
jgi:hypothetical protein